MNNDQRDIMLQETHDAVTKLVAAWPIVDDLKTTVYGNGRDGLKTRVSNIEAVVKAAGVLVAGTLLAAVGWAFSKI